MKWRTEPDWKSLAALEQLASQEVARNARSSGAWHSLIAVQRKSGKIDEANTSLDAASAAFGSDAQGRKDFVALLLKLSEHDRAIVEAEALVESWPQDDGAHLLLQRAVVGSDRWGKAQQRALAKKPSPEPVALSLNQTWKLAETDADFRALARRCRAMLEQNPVHTDARCFLAHALAQCGEDAEARTVMALDKLVWIGDLPLAPGYPSAEQFRAELATEIRRNPTLAPDPKHKATRDGWQTLRLGLPDESAIAALVREIKAAIIRYGEALNAHTDPFVTFAPETVSLNQWAVIYGATGRQTSHRHPVGWLSGVYYVAAPRADADNTYRGSLLVGAPHAKLNAPPPWGIMKIDPVPGRIVLFPSFVTHATEPCGSDGDRISVAFDVIPAERK